MANISLGYRIQTLMRIHQEVLRGKYPNARGISKILQVSIKTAKKYIRDLQEFMGNGPLYDPYEHGYHYPNQVSAQLTPRLNEQEVLAYFLLEETARTLAGTPVHDYLNSALNKFSAMLPVGGTLTLSDVSHAMSLRLERAPARAAAPEILTKLCHAITERKQVHISYEGRDRGQSTKRVIDPLHLTRCEGQWYLMAYCRLRKDIRTFVPSRIVKIDVRKENFDPPAGFDPKEHFKSAFGIVAHRKLVRAVLVFNKDIAPYITERSWHPTQTIELLSDGRARMSLTCSPSQELARWLLGWGSSVYIESPLQLRREVQREHQASARVK